MTSSIETLLESLGKRAVEFRWKESDVVGHSRENSFLKRLLYELLEELNAFFKATHGYAAVTSIEPAYFVPIAAVNRDSETIVKIPSHPKKTSCAIAKYLWSGDDFQVIRSINKDPDYKGDPNCPDKVLLRLIAAGDFYGFLSLDGHGPFPIEDNPSAGKELAATLSTIVGDAIFSHRLRKIGSSFHKKGSGIIDELYDEIATTAALAFGADGAVLRIWKESEETLNVRGMDGDVHPMQLEANSPAEQMALRILNSDERPFAVVSHALSAPTQEIGMQQPTELRNSLAEIGMQAFMLIRLRSDSFAMNAQGALGTLAVFHLRPHHYSWRDVGLLLSFAKRAADEIVINTQRASLEETNLKLTAAQAEVMEQQEIVDELNQNSIRGEMLAYLRHDLGHKAIAIDHTFEEFTDSVKRAIRERQSWDKLQQSHNKMLLAITEIKTTVNSFFEMSAGPRVAEKDFDIKGTALALATALKPGLRRYNMEVDVRGDSGMIRHGNVEIFRHILFNLINNSREAHTRRGGRSENTVTITCKKVLEGGESYAVIQHSDQGPGIDRRIFNGDFEDIFKPYTTSKPPDTPGAGLGLFLSRQALTRYFQGDLVLVDPYHAVFQIKIKIQ